MARGYRIATFVILLAALCILQSAKNSVAGVNAYPGETWQLTQYLVCIAVWHSQNLLSANLCGVQEFSVDEYKGKIPRILHYIYLSGFDAYIAETKKPRAKLATWYRETCEEVNKHWEIKFWTEEMAYELVSTKFPEFLPIWRSYDMEVCLQ